VWVAARLSRWCCVPMAEPISAIRPGLARTKHEPDGDSDEEHAMTGRTQSLTPVAAVAAAGDAGELTRRRAP